MATSPQPQLTPEPPTPPEQGSRGLIWLFVGHHGLRAGWSVLLAYCIFYFFRLVAGTVFYAFGLVGDHVDYSPTAMFVLEAIPFLAMLIAGIIMAAIEHRRILDYNLTGPRPVLHAVSGFCAGLIALSALIAILYSGGWLSFGSPALSGAEILRYATLWACAYLLVAGTEEGLFRCYLQYTLTRGISFWWALLAEAGLCLYAFLNARGDGAIGVYAAAAVGLLPCFILDQRGTPRSGFWQAAWVSSTFFGMVHTFNGGENWRGIFAASCIGFVFCVSIRVTGSVWWAIGCHAAWDWAETYIYGTANSGLPAQGHLFSSTPAGNPLLSGGADGPEGSLFAFAAILLLLALVLIVHRRRNIAAQG
jgi:membrane protease YdiL (CAAX protease family)